MPLITNVVRLEISTFCNLSSVTCSLFSFASCCPFTAVKECPKILVCGLTVLATPNVFEVDCDVPANRGFDSAVDLTWSDGVADFPKVKEVETLLFTVSLSVLAPKTLLDETFVKGEGTTFLKPQNDKLPDDCPLTAETGLESTPKLAFDVDESKVNELFI